MSQARGARFAAAAGHRLAAEAAAQVYEKTGNVFDAAAAATLACAVLEPNMFGLGGEVTGIVHSQGRVRVLAGCTRAPRRMTIEAFHALGLDRVPGDGLLCAGPPALLHAVLVLLRDHGTAPLSVVAAPAIELAGSGFAAGPFLAQAVDAHRKVFATMWPSSERIWAGVREGGLVCQPELAETLTRLAASSDPFEDLRTGWVAQAILRTASEPAPWPISVGDPFASDAVSAGGVHASFLDASDLAGFEVCWEEPLSWTDRHGRRICKAGPWSQGPVLLQMLATLEAGGFDRLIPGSDDYLHAYLECAKMAFADREGFYGDGPVPLSELLDPGYAAARAALVTERAQRFGPGLAGGWTAPGGRVGTGSDTTHVDVADSSGDVAVLTPSGGWFSSPVIPELGFPLGTRCQMFWLDPSSPSALVPGRRPRTTLTPTLVLRDGRPLYALGSPGGDSQDQTQAQILHALAHGAGPGEAVDMATVVSTDMASSFYPRGCEPLGVSVEGRLCTGLASRGHRVRVAGDWVHGRPQVIDIGSGGLTAAASRRTGTAGVVAF